MPMPGFSSSEITIFGADGVEKGKARAMVSGNLAVIDDAKLQIAKNDEVRRKLPNGAEEVFIVTDPEFYEDFDDIPAHYQLKLRRKEAAPFPAQNQSFHLSGPNARVNINSQDYSVNTANSGDEFSRLRAALTNEISDPAALRALLALTHSLEQQAGKPGFGKTYQTFIASAGEHIKIITPFLPMLSQLFGHLTQ